MCGIAGYINFDIDDELISRMTDCISHRGPNDAGWSKICAGHYHGIFGHRRLSILDLTKAGHQPMRRGKWTVTYNGEIYNFVHIKSELESKGYLFNSHCDTEILCASLEEWGLDAIQKFNGMFAFAACDGNKVYLVRDRIGIKPLFYYHNNGALAFASELQSLECLPGFEKKININAFYEYMIFGYISAPGAIYNNCYKVEPGQIISFSPNGLEQQYYWNLDLSKKDSFTGSEEDALDELDFMVKDSIKKRLISDVPIGTFLSGGIDSSLVSAIAAKEFNSTTKTFSIGFENSDYDESSYAEEIAKFLGTNHKTTIMAEKDLLNIFPEIPGICGEPFFDNSILPTSLLSSITKENVTVALSGDGGDEFFFGYPVYSTIQKYRKIETIPFFIRKAAAEILKWMSQGKHGNLLGFHNCIEAFISYSIFPPKDFKSCFNKQHDYTPYGQFKWIKRLMRNGLSEKSLLPYLDQHYYMVDDILTKVDRASMHSSLEVRVPLLDHELVEFINTLPDNIKSKEGSNKYILKKLLAKYVPAKLWDRPKKGFTCPYAYWLKNELKDSFQELVLTGENPFINKSFIKKLWTNDSDDNLKNHNILWAVLLFEQWRKQKNAYF